jgi:predicted NBD/HSP70 family sugar kinase
VLEKQDVTVRESLSGGNQSGLRDRNARLILSLIRRQESVASAELARLSGLSAQTVSNIVRALESEGLLNRGEAVKGKVGKPLVPMSLNPRGVYSLGLNIGRRSAELVLVDFNGGVIERRATAYRYPVIEDVFAFLDKGYRAILEAHPVAKGKVTGIGVGRPYEIWSWLSVVDAPREAMEAWKSLDLPERVSSITGLYATIQNDATAACVAEHLLGRGGEWSNFAYFFIGAFIGGGLVLDNTVVTGPSGNAGAFGALLVPQPDGTAAQLLDVASLHVLERALIADGIDPDELRMNDEKWAQYGEWVAPWVEQTAKNLAMASVTAATVVEIEAVLIDGAMPEHVRRDLVAATRRHIAPYTATGIIKPSIEEATVGRNARSIGAALLPVHAKYFTA